MKKIFFVFIIHSIAYYSHAQKKTSFLTQNYVGFLAGSSDNALQLQTINGISFNKLFAGLGLGVDWYYQRSIPFFLSIEKGFLIKQGRNIYFSTAAGANFPWKYTAYADEWYWGGRSKAYPGFYWNAGFGYRISIGKQNDAVLLHFGLSNKFYKEKVTTTMPCLWGPCPESSESLKYNLRAFSFKLGYGF
jgi:hypothetical protein